MGGSTPRAGDRGEVWLRSDPELGRPLAARRVVGRGGAADRYAGTISAAPRPMP